MSRAGGLERSEADVLAGMMGADSRRVDDLVSDIGQVKGDVRGLRGDVVRLTEGVDDLRGAMTVLTKHSLLMESITTDLTSMRVTATKLDDRLREVELEMPALKETRLAMMRGVWGLVALVCLALVGLVLKAKGLP